MSFAIDGSYYGYEPADGECEHDDMEDGQCLDCGKDCSEDLMAAAYDRAKDLRKYGE